MAARDHKDLHSGSQDFSSSFIQHFVDHEEAWYIKNSSGRYILANNALLELYSLKAETIFNKTDKELMILTPYFRRKRDEREKYVLLRRKVIKSVEINYFQDESSLSVRNYITTPFLYGDEVMTLTHIRKPDNVNVIQIIFDNLNITYERLANIEPTIERQPSSFCGINPMNHVSEKQWEDAWLVLAGLSQREIARHTRINVNNVDKKLQAAYKNLGVYCQHNFIVLGEANNWISYVPGGLLKHERSFVIKK